MVKLTKLLVFSFVAASFIACGAGGGAKGTAPTEEQRLRLEESRAETENAERILLETKMMRIQLEQQLEERP